MSLLSQTYGNLYKSDEVSRVHVNKLVNMFTLFPHPFGSISRGTSLVDSLS
jgi:hypothetical protein